MDETKLEVGRGFAEMIQITCDQLTSEKEEEKPCVDKLEHGLTTVYDGIRESTKELERSTEENINMIAQKNDRYK